MVCGSPGLWSVCGRGVGFAREGIFSRDFVGLMVVVKGVS